MLRIIIIILLLFCVLFAQGKDCEANIESPCYGTALKTHPLLGKSFVYTQQYQSHH